MKVYSKEETNIWLLFKLFKQKKSNSKHKLNCSFRYILLLVVKLNTQLSLMSSISNSLPKSLWNLIDTSTSLAMTFQSIYHLDYKLETTNWLFKKDIKVTFEKSC